MPRSLFILSLAALLSLFGLPASISQAGFVAEDLYTLTPPPGPGGGFPTGLFNFAMAPGVSGVQTTFNSPQTSLYDGSGTPQPLGTPAADGASGNTRVSGINANQQIGSAFNGGLGAGVYHAVIWSGSTASAVDLNPTNLSGFSESEGFGLSGNQQVGQAWNSAAGQGSAQAILWTGANPALAVDLHPTSLAGTYAYSQASATNGVQQAGYAGFNAGPNSIDDHAMLWTGTSASAVDLHPTQLGMFDSRALAVEGGEQVGFGDIIGVGSHAVVWHGTAASAVDLSNPTVGGYAQSIADATNGTEQAGYSTDGTVMGNAMLWSGTAGSAMNLVGLLPSGFAGSRAYSIDSSGDVYGIAIDSAGNYHAIEWAATPEPAALGLLTCAGAALLVRRRSANCTRSE